MQRFLGELVKTLSTQDFHYRNTTLILPSQRAAVFLKQEFTLANATKSTWLPRIVTFNEWMGEVSGITPADSLELKFIFYTAYSNVYKSEAQSISDVFSWCDVLIKDFNDLDSHLIDNAKFFKNLSNYTEIEHFSFLKAPLTQKQQQYQRFWNKMPELHRAFKTELQKAELGYPGMIASLASEKMDNFLNATDGKFLVAGLNALSGAEKAILKKIEAAGRGKVYYDADPFYINEKNHHAGLFIRRNINEKIGEILAPPESLSEKNQDITIHTAGHELDQADVVAGLLENLNPDELKNTALVLADEKFLIPLLSRLPESLSAPNITMGIGLLDTLFNHFIDILQELRSNQSATMERKEPQISNHPFIRKLFAVNPKDSKALKAVCVKFVEDANPKGETYFSSVKTLLDRFNEVVQNTRSDSFVILQTRIILTEMTRCINRLEKTGSTAELDQKIINGLLKRAVSGKQLSLLSEPTENLQILGLLETRALGFDRVILCSANEDIIPGSPRLDSFFPFEIKGHHKLPGRREKECVFAYHFYRLLHDAKNVDIIHFSESGGVRSSEKSRYIQQLDYQLSRINSNLTLHHKTHGKELPAAHVKNQVLEKTPEVIENITKHLKRGISPSSFNRYLEDSLEWYYGNVLKLQEPERSPLDSAGFGTIVHRVLELLYKNRLNKIITEAEMDAIDGEVEDALKKAFEEIEGMNAELKGVLAINYQLAKKMVTNYLMSERKLLKAGDLVEVKGCEKSLGFTKNLSINGQEMEMKFKGQIDRLEVRNSQLYLVDFKTGRVQAADVKTNEIERDKLAGKRYYNQLMLYKWLAQAEYPESGNASGQIITLTAPHQRSLISEYTGKADEWQAFENVVVEIIEEMLNEDIPLQRNPDFKYPVFEQN